MAKKSKRQTDKNGVEICCENCANNTGIGAMGYMYHCSFLSYCTPFGWGRCEAEEKGKGKFKEK